MATLYSTTVHSDKYDQQQWELSFKPTSWKFDIFIIATSAIFNCSIWMLFTIFLYNKIKKIVFDINLLLSTLNRKIIADC